MLCTKRRVFHESISLLWCSFDFSLERQSFHMRPSEARLYPAVSCLGNAGDSCADHHISPLSISLPPSNMATSSTLHDLRIPAEWRALCQILISDVLVSSRCFGTLAEIFDGYQTTETLMETNDYMSLIENSGQEKSSEAAIRDAKSWTCELDVGKIELDHFWSGELVKLFSKSDKDTERFVGVALCVFKPVIRWCFEHYCKRLLERGKSIPNFGWWLSSSSNVERMQDWGEARIFGGLLAISKHQVVLYGAVPK